MACGRPQGVRNALASAHDNQQRTRKQRGNYQRPLQYGDTGGAPNLHTRSNSSAGNRGGDIRKEKNDGVTGSPVNDAL